MTVTPQAAKYIQDCYADVRRKERKSAIILTAHGVDYHEEQTASVFAPHNDVMEYATL